MLRWFKARFKIRSQMELAEEYLADATSIQDLERRMRELERQGVYQYR